jgi:hypothetical protein
MTQNPRLAKESTCSSQNGAVSSTVPAFIRQCDLV